MATGYIKIGDKTSGHGEWLATGSRVGNYSVVQEEKRFVVTGKGVFRDTLDLSGPDGGVAVLKDVIAKGDLITYRTKITFQGGVTLSGVFAAPRLGPASALMVKPAKAGPKATGTIFDAL